MESENKAKHWSENLILRLAANIAALSIIVTNAYIVFSSSKSFLIADFAQVVLVGANLSALTAFIFFLAKKYELEFKNSEGKANYCNLLGVKPRGEKTNLEIADDNNQRANKLVEQLRKNIIGYIVCLIIVYLTFLFDNKELLGESYESIHIYFKKIEDIFNFLSAVFLYFAFKVLYDETLDSKNKELPYRLWLSIISLIIVVSYILYSVININSVKSDKTETIKKPSEIVKDIKEQVNKYENSTDENAKKEIEEIKKEIEIYSNELKNEVDDKKPALSSIVKIKDRINTYQFDIDKTASNTITEIKNITKNTNGIWQNLFQLFVGIFNGLAMFLLFARYISMEHAVRFIFNEEKYKQALGETQSKLVPKLTIYLLPIYALAQPLFGSFEIDAFGPPEVFANIVFFICVIGKIFFLYLTLLFIKKRLMHFYLHLIITSHAGPKTFETCFDIEANSKKKVTLKYRLQKVWKN